MIQCPTPCFLTSSSSELDSNRGLIKRIYSFFQSVYKSIKGLGAWLISVLRNRNKQDRIDRAIGKPESWISLSSSCDFATSSAGFQPYGGSGMA
jgi:hypothetical protein